MKTKKLFFAFIIGIAILLASSKSKAATSTATTTTSNGGTIAWSFSYDTTTKQITNLECTNKSAISGEIEIPSTITVDGEAYTVVNLDGSAFYSAKAVTKLVIPSTVVSMGESKWGCFAECTALEEIDLGNVANLGYRCFYRCSSLKTIKIPDGIKVIPNQAFLGATSLTDITFSDKLTSIGVEAFEYCSSLQSFNMPDTVTSIGRGAFSDCTNLKNLTISNNIQELPEHAFSYCKSLTKVTIPDSIVSIQSDDAFEGAFSRCESLQSVTIPDTVTFIGEYAFYDCGKGKMELFVKKGSYAETWAKKNNVTYNYGDGSSQTPTTGDDEKQESDQKTPSDENGSSSNSGTGSSSTSGQSAKKTDITQSSKIIPQTGESIIVISVISIAVIAGVILLCKFRKMKDIN